MYLDLHSEPEPDDRVSVDLTPDVESGEDESRTEDDNSHEYPHDLTTCIKEKFADKSTHSCTH